MHYRCVHCGQRVFAPDTLIGQYVCCLNCGGGNTVPEPDRQELMPGQSDGLCCIFCGYQLRGLTENRCPECGRRFDPGFVFTHQSRIAEDASFRPVAYGCLVLAALLFALIFGSAILLEFGFYF